MRTAAPVPLMHGEALFSLLGRWLRVTGAPNATEFLVAITQRMGRKVSLAFPGNLEVVRTAHPLLAVLGPEELVLRYTAASLYRPFLTTTGWAHLVAGSTTRDPRQARMYLGLARAGGDVLKPLHCPQCMQEQLQKDGQVFWPLRFALPNVSACPEHQLLLQAVQPSSLVKLGKHKYLGFPSTEDAGNAPRVRPTKSALMLSALSIDLAAARLGSIRPVDLVSTYLVGLRARGLVEPGGRVRRIALWEALKVHWGERAELQVSVGRTFPAWLTQLYARGGALVRIPTYHLLLIGFLFKDIATWRKTLDGVRGQQLPGRQEIALARPQASPAMGTRLVQLRHWLALQGPESKVVLPPAALVLLERGRPVREVADEAAVSRYRIYRALRSSPELARKWALSSVATEHKRRVAVLESCKGRRPAAQQAVQTKKWLYRHRSAMPLFQS